MICILEREGELATRPVFVASQQRDAHVEVQWIDFKWFPGMAKSQKQKSIDALHQAIDDECGAQTLEISSKSRQPLGIALSAFNLGFVHPQKNRRICVESAFQGSKVFEQGGPFPDLYWQSARDAKKYMKDKKMGPLREFCFFGQTWPLSPRTAFYDWLYLNSLQKNQELTRQLLNYACFTDIEFNPKRSINCQAYSAALYVSLHKAGTIENLLSDWQRFIAFMKTQPDWIAHSQFAKHHTDPAQRLL